VKINQSSLLFFFFNLYAFVFSNLDYSPNIWSQWNNHTDHDNLTLTKNSILGFHQPSFFVCECSLVCLSPLSLFFGS
jgi:hypothetical protein